MYLQLLSGSADPQAELEETECGYGQDGPAFHAIQVNASRSMIMLDPFSPLGCALHIVDGMVYYDGMWYRDWTIGDAPIIATVEITGWEASLAEPPGTTRRTLVDGSVITSYPLHINQHIESAPPVIPGGSAFGIRGLRNRRMHPRADVTFTVGEWIKIVRLLRRTNRAHVANEIVALLPDAPNEQSVTIPVIEAHATFIARAMTNTEAVAEEAKWERKQ